MGFIVRVLTGFGIAAIGAFFVIRTSVIIDLFGTSEWAERRLGGGGSNLAYKGLGLIAIFVGFLVVTNLWNAFLGATLGALLSRPG